MSGQAKNETHARLASPGNWGGYGNSGEHLRYVRLMDARFRNRRRCGCGCPGKASHVGMCNGVALTSGCELSMRRWTRDPQAGVRAAAERYWAERMAQPNAAIRCSAEECPALVVREIGENLRTTRAHARADGWRRTPDLADVCPEHAEDVPPSWGRGSCAP